MASSAGWVGLIVATATNDWVRTCKYRHDNVHAHGRAGVPRALGRVHHLSLAVPLLRTQPDSVPASNNCGLHCVLMAMPCSLPASPKTTLPPTNCTALASEERSTSSWPRDHQLLLLQVPRHRHPVRPARQTTPRPAQV
ncbi:hypothetical protein WMY93_031177 [Mugilogobius chulae]|uniref:Secreted protein n=1 Tax=Mugilogobius chulae TaxID=88201 RepID=A0AAW0MER2_9GOBI